MSVRRYQPDGRSLDKHRSIQYPPAEPERPYCLKKINRSRNRVNTKSLQSIEINRGSTLLTIKSKSNRRKLLSIERSDAAEVNTERAEPQQSIRQHHDRSYRPPHRQMRTIEGGNLQAKEKQIRECIQLMQGVLSEIQNQKSQKGVGVVKTIPPPIQVQAQPQASAEQSMLIKSPKQGQLSKFQSYVRNVCNRQDSKVIILRKAKTRSLLTQNNAARSTAILNLHKLDTIPQAQPKEIPMERKRRDKPYFCGGMEELECSSIEADNNQSSFISSIGKEALMRQLEEEKEKSTLESGKLIHRLKNHRKLKNVFPDGFF